MMRKELSRYLFWLSRYSQKSVFGGKRYHYTLILARHVHYRRIVPPLRQLAHGIKQIARDPRCLWHLLWTDCARLQHNEKTLGVPAQSFPTLPVSESGVGILGYGCPWYTKTKRYGLVTSQDQRKDRDLALAESTRLVSTLIFDLCFKVLNLKWDRMRF